MSKSHTKTATRSTRSSAVESAASWGKDFRTARGSNLITWAVDPFDEDLNPQGGGIAAINSIADDSTVIQPVYVWSGGLPDEVQASSKSIRSELAIHGDRILATLGKKHLKVRMNPLVVLERPLVSATDSALALVKYSRSKGARLIVANHHNNQGLERWLLGSFVETLSHVSDISVLVAPPEWKGGTAGKRILFPTDFSDASFQAFETAVQFAKSQKRKITIFHKIEYPSYPAYHLGYLPPAHSEKLNVRIRENAKVQIQSMIGMAADRGVKTTMLIEESHQFRVMGAILEELERGYGLVMMAAHSGVLARTLLGSTTRSMLRDSTVPVWILRPDRRSAKSHRSAIKRSSLFQIRHDDAVLI